MARPCLAGEDGVGMAGLRPLCEGCVVARELAVSSCRALAVLKPADGLPDLIVFPVDDPVEGGAALGRADRNLGLDAAIREPDSDTGVDAVLVRRLHLAAICGRL